jgi:O-antigen/teichoic acid export membrane protein
VAPLRAIAGTSYGLAAAQSAILVVLGLALIPLVLSQHESAVVRYGLIFCAVIPFGLLSLYVISLLNGIERFRSFNFFRVLVIALSTAALLALAAAGELTVRNGVYAYLGAQVVTALASFAFAMRATGGATRPDRPLARRMLAYGWRSQVSTASNLLNVRLDQLVISIFLSASSLGLYVVAYTMTSLTSVIGSSVFYAALPAVASRETDPERREVAREYVGLTLVASILVTVPLFVFAPQLLELAFGEQFREAADITRVLLAASVMIALGRVLGAVLKGANRPLDAGWAETIGLGATAVGLAVGLPLLGTMGAAITSAVAYTLSCAFALRWANRALGARGLELLVPRRPTTPAPGG